MKRTKRKMECRARRGSNMRQSLGGRDQNSRRKSGLYPWRAAILLVAGDKSAQWDKWYRTAIPRAERLYDDYLAERRKEMKP
jgi:hypothetical protein